MRGACHKGKANRIIEIDPKLMRYKSIAKERLNSERGIKYRSKRAVSICFETASFTRFSYIRIFINPYQRDALWTI